MPDYNELEAKTERAFAAVILAAGATTEDLIFLGHDADEMVAGSCYVHARGGREVQIGTGIHALEVEVTTRSSGHKGYAEDGYTQTDPVPAHNSLTAKVRDAVLQDNIVTLLNAAGIAEFTAIDVLNSRPSSGIDGESGLFLNSLMLTVIAAAASI